jgi:hypothetical protein
MKKKKQKQSKQASDLLQSYQRVRHTVEAYGKDLFLHRHIVLEIGGVLLFGAVCAGIFVSFLLLSSDDDYIPEPEKPQLSVSVIEDIEQWITARETEYARSLSIPSQVFTPTE